MSSKKSDNLLLIFSKKIKLGKVKTRIADKTSSRFAYLFAKACFSDLLKKIKKSEYYNLLLGVDDYDAKYWFKKKYSLNSVVIKKHVKKNIDYTQSDKMREVFDECLKKYKKVILIPMDIPFITEDEIILSFLKLEKYKVVLGPEFNGGVYLIGFNCFCVGDVFEGVRWSTKKSFSDLYKNSINAFSKKDIFVLKTRNDLNTLEDIYFSKNDITHNCFALSKLLKKTKIL